MLTGGQEALLASPLALSSCGTRQVESDALVAKPLPCYCWQQLNAKVRTRCEFVISCNACRCKSHTQRNVQVNACFVHGVGLVRCLAG
jgi:hypothetical protein